MPRRKSVKIYSKTAGGVLYLRFDDPRAGIRKQVNVSAHTDQRKVAERIAEELTRIINTPSEWTQLPSGLYPRTVEIWKPLSTDIREALNSIPLITSTMVASLPDNFTERLEDPASQQVLRFMEMEDQLRELLDDLYKTTLERDYYRERFTLADGQLRKMGAKTIKDASPRLIAEAVKAYFKATDGPKASGEWRYILMKWCERFSTALDKGRNAQDIEPDEIIAHIQGQDVADGTKKKLTFALCAFLDWASYRQFDTDHVKNAILPHLEDEETEWFWLTRKQCQLLIKNLVNATDGNYWADAAMLQYACGFRPEEIPLLQRSRVSKVDGQQRIFVSRIMDGGKRVRRIKTKNSEDSINVPSFALPALNRRMKVQEFLLFPLPSFEALPQRFKDRFTSFEIENRLWPSADDHYFSDVYLMRLRAAAAKITGLDSSKIDSRILRRTCARELVLKYGYERAASVIRDNIDTLRKHYANLQSSDTSTER